MDFGVGGAVADYVEGGVYGFAHREFVGDIFAGDVVACAVGGRCAHERQSAVMLTPLSVVSALNGARPWSWYMASTAS